MPEAVGAPVLGQRDAGAAAGAGDADIGEPTFLFEADLAVFIEGPLVGEETVFPAGQEDGVEFKTLGRVQRHDRDGVLAFAAIAVHDQRNVFEESRSDSRTLP